MATTWLKVYRNHNNIGYHRICLRSTPGIVFLKYMYNNIEGINLVNGHHWMWWSFFAGQPSVQICRVTAAAKPQSGSRGRKIIIISNIRLHLDYCMTYGGQVGGPASIPCSAAAEQGSCKTDEAVENDRRE